MRPTDPHRRALLLGTLAAALAPSGLRAAADPILIDWGDLIPEGVDSVFRGLQSMGVLDHGAVWILPGMEEALTATTDRFNGARVKMPGFIIPLDGDSQGVREILLVPFVGACIHVPPPPPNQLVYVTTETPYRDAGLFDPVWVTGVFNEWPTETELAEVGYILEAEKIEPYDG